MPGRENQKQRTRTALIEAYIELVREGESPSVAEVAEAAQVSVATAYRYFPNTRSLQADASVAPRHNMPDYDAVLAAAGDDPLVRIEALVRSIATWQFGDEAVWRRVQQATLERWFAQVDHGGLDDRGQVEEPIRSSARKDVVSQALSPLEPRLSTADFQRLVSAVIMTCGVEALISTRDAAQLSPAEATETMVWAARALVTQAMHSL
ncbi:TetR/AcrR family transcriptional regulator [Kribbella sp. NPDC058245]|uniref:TetR/AcrR family transcriptional regulator n=1 Tax=Kribbella sp. NPDC058245 TaxID=3346399 RepID=UPI0036E8B2E0